MVFCDPVVTKITNEAEEAVKGLGRYPLLSEKWQECYNFLLGIHEFLRVLSRKVDVYLPFGEILSAEFNACRLFSFFRSVSSAEITPEDLKWFLETSVDCPPLHEVLQEMRKVYIRRGLKALG